jgi:predicted XRE-type DNA-binding protein
MNAQNIYFESGYPVDEATRLALRSDFASMIRERLQQDYPTQKAAERALGIPQSTVSNIMCGNTRRLSLDYLVGLAARLSIPWSAQCRTPPHDAGAVAAAPAAAVTRKNDFDVVATSTQDVPHGVSIRGGVDAAP